MIFSFTLTSAHHSFCARSTKSLVFALLCRGRVGGSPLSREPTEVKHYARRARLPRFTLTSAHHSFCARSTKSLVFALLCILPPLKQTPLREKGCRSRNATRQGRKLTKVRRGAHLFGSPFTGVISAQAMRAAVLTEAFLDVQRYARKASEFHRPQVRSTYESMPPAHIADAPPNLKECGV